MWEKTMGFIKLLKSLKTKTPKGKTASRKSKKELVDEIREKENNKGEKIMPNEKEEVKTEEKVEKSTPTEETTKTTETEKKEEVETKPSEDANVDNGDNNPEDKGEEQGDNNTIQDIQEPETPNAIAVEDLVTKEDLRLVLEAFSAKLDAVLKENKDLTDKLANSEKENSGLKEKYEDKDFGDMAKQGSIVKDNDANDSFDDYARKFM